MRRHGIVHLRDGRGDCLIGRAEDFDRRFRLAASQNPARLGARLDQFHGRSESMAKLRRLHAALHGGIRTVQASDADILGALRRGLANRRLVMVCSQPVAPLTVPRGQSLADSLAAYAQLAATVTTTAGAPAGPAIGGPAPAPATPVAGWTLERRIERVLRLTQDKLPGAMRAEFAELISPQAIAITVGIIVVWAASHGTPVGPAVDIILLLVGIVALGWGIFEAAAALYDFIAAILGAKSERDLDRAAQHLARAISLLGVAAFAALLRKIGRTGRPRDRGRTTSPARPAAEPASPPPIEIGRRTQQNRPQQGGQSGSGGDAGVAASRTVGRNGSNRGSVEGANFAQTGIRSDRRFSDDGRQIYSDLAGRPVDTVDDLSDALRKGEISPSDVPVDFVDMNGTRLILNTRTSTALQDAGIPRSQWYGSSKTGQTAYRNAAGNPVTFDDLAAQQLRRNDLPPTGSPTLPTGQ